MEIPAIILRFLPVQVAQQLKQGCISSILNNTEQSGKLYFATTGPQNNGCMRVEVGSTTGLKAT